MTPFHYAYSPRAAKSILTRSGRLLTASIVKKLMCTFEFSVNCAKPGRRVTIALGGTVSNGGFLSSQLLIECGKHASLHRKGGTHGMAFYM